MRDCVRAADAFLQDSEHYFQEMGAYFFSKDGKPCMPLEEILRLPGPGTLAYEWIGTDNPLWH